MRSGLIYTGITALVALGVAQLGAGLVAAPGRDAVRAGAAVAFASQVLLFWLLFVWIFPRRLVLAHGLGVLGRFFVVALTALVGVPLLGLPAAPTLFALVAVCFVTTLLEPLFLRSSGAGSGGVSSWAQQTTLTQR